MLHKQMHGPAKMLQPEIMRDQNLKQHHAIVDASPYQQKRMREASEQAVMYRSNLMPPETFEKKTRYSK